MTVAEMIARRTTELTAIKAASNAAVAAKGGTPADNLSGLPAAIESIPSGGDLPELTTPAAESDVLAGKEYIDGSGTKKAGTLVVCDSIAEAETIGVPGVGLSVEIESPADGSTGKLKLPEPNLLAENIKNGVSIFNVNGTAKTLRVETGTITPAEDVTSLVLPCAENPKMIVVSATDAAMEAILSGSVNAALTAVGTNTAIKTGAVGSMASSYRAIITMFVGSAAQVVQGTQLLAMDSGVILSTSSGYPWKAGCEYAWTAYNWEDGV